MDKRNLVSEGRYKGSTVVFSRGTLWINSGILSLVRIAPGLLKGALDLSGEERLISVTYLDGTSSVLKLDEQLYRLGLCSLGLAEPKLPADSERKDAEFSSEKASPHKPSGPTQRSALCTFGALFLLGVAAVLVFRLMGKI